MKILSYNVYGVIDSVNPIPAWKERQKNIDLILNNLLSDHQIKVCFFQEVNENNFKMIEQILTKYNFIIPELFPMITDSILQYNVVAYRDIDFQKIVCLPHGKDDHYLLPNEQRIDYGMSDYRTTVFLHFCYHEKTFVLGNTHADYISSEGKINGIIKSLKYLDTYTADYKFIVGDMNMVSHMAEVYQILTKTKKYVTLSRSSEFDVLDQSWHGYGTKEQVNVDFAFIPKDYIHCYSYKIVRQDSMMQEGSDHRPVIIEIRE